MPVETIVKHEAKAMPYIQIKLIIKISIIYGKLMKRI